MDRKNGYERYKYDGYAVYGTISSPEEEHAVEDARTRKGEPPERPREKNHRTEKEPNVKKRERSGTILITLIAILCFSATVFAADLMSGSGSFSSYASIFLGKKEKKNYDSYYLVYATHSEDMGISYKNAAAVRKEGGAGYVIKLENEYYVALNAYERKEDANVVSERSLGYGVYELKLLRFDKKKASDLSAAEKSESVYKKICSALYESANLLSESACSPTDVKAALLPLKEELGALEEAFEKGANEKESTAFIDYKVLLRTMKAALENLLSEEKDLVSLLRYYSVSILHSQALFREKYFS